MQGFIGEIRMFAGNFAPNGWLFCQGQTLDIAEYDTLFNLIGTTYGGDGQSNFRIPDLSSRLPVGTGQAPGSPTNYQSGDMGGSETTSITLTNLPSHTHPLTGSAGILSSAEDGHRASPVSNAIAGNGELIYSSTTDNTVMAPANVSLTAASAGTTPPPIENIKPVLAMNYIISLYGIYPSPQ